MNKNKEDLVNRLRNWKFTDAYVITQAMTFNAEHEVVRDIITSLSVLFGNCGWFPGTLGELLENAVDLCCTVLEGGKL